MSSSFSRSLWFASAAILTSPVTASTGEPEFVGMSAYVAAGGNYVAYLAPESAVGQDLDGDGMTNDTVLEYKHIDTGAVTNTGVPVYPFRW